MPQATRQAMELLQETLIGEAAARGAAAVFVTGDDLRYVAVNEAACDVLGYTRDELLALPVSEVVISTRREASATRASTSSTGDAHGTARVGGRTATKSRSGTSASAARSARCSQVVTVTWRCDDDVDSGDGNASAAAGRGSS